MGPQATSAEPSESFRKLARFSYTAISASGDAVSGEINAESEAIALDQIARKGLTPVDLKSRASAETWWRRDISLTARRGSLTPAELERFFFTLSAMLRAGFPLPRAMSFCEKQSHDRRAKRVLAAIRAEIEGGATLGQAMRGAESAFPERFISLVSTGENANRLDLIVAQAAALLASEARMRRETRAALIYPAILLIMSAAVMGVIVFYLAPTLLPVFSAADVEPPSFLNALARVGDVLATSWPTLLALAALVTSAALGARRKIAPIVAALLFHLPLTGTYLRKLETLRLCQSLRLMLLSGASLPRALGSARVAVSTVPFRALLSEAADRVVAGGALADSLKPGSLVDATALALIEAGEESDRLSEVLGTVVETLAAETSAQLSQAIRLLTPLLTLVIGLTVGGLILTTISAIMDLNDIAF